MSLTTAGGWNQQPCCFPAAGKVCGGVALGVGLVPARSWVPGGKRAGRARAELASETPGGSPRPPGPVGWGPQRGRLLPRVSYSVRAPWGSQACTAVGRGAGSRTSSESGPRICTAKPTHPPLVGRPGDFGGKTWSPQPGPCRRGPSRPGARGRLVVRMRVTISLRASLCCAQQLPRRDSQPGQGGPRRHLLLNVGEPVRGL